MNNSILHNPNYALHYRLIDDDVRHITPEEASFAWSNQMFRRPRPRADPLQIAALGHDSHGTMIEMVAYDAGAYADRNGNPQNPRTSPWSHGSGNCSTNTPNGYAANRSRTRSRSRASATRAQSRPA